MANTNKKNKRKNKKRQSKGINKTTRVYGDVPIRQIVAAKDRVLRHVTFAGCSTYKGVKIRGFEKIYGMIDRKYVPDVEELAKSDLRHTSRAWQFWIGIFCTDGEDVWVEEEYVDHPNLSVNELDAWLQEHIKRFADECEEGTGKGYGWIGTPCPEYDLEASSQEFIKFFESHDVYNEELRTAIYNEYIARKAKEAQEQQEANLAIQQALEAGKALKIEYPSESGELPPAIDDKSVTLTYAPKDAGLRLRDDFKFDDDVNKMYPNVPVVLPITPQSAGMARVIEAGERQKNEVVITPKD